MWDLVAGTKWKINVELTPPQRKRVCAVIPISQKYQIITIYDLRLTNFAFDPSGKNHNCVEDMMTRVLRC